MRFRLHVVSLIRNISKLRYLETTLELARALGIDIDEEDLAREFGTIYKEGVVEKKGGLLWKGKFFILHNLR